jgi:uncharacterized membrane protein YoaK (UPF0700 family)
MIGVREKYDSEAKLSWVLAALAGLLGATAYTHSEGYFVTFMTGNAQRAVLGFFRGEHWLAVSAGMLILAFVAGVVSASLCRRHLWPTRPHGATVLTTLSLVLATVLDITVGGGPALPLPFLPIALVTFGVGTLNTTFVEDGEVSIPLSYVTGTLVKMGQGIERHLNGGTLEDWLGYFLLFAGFAGGAAAGGFISVVTGGTQMLVAASGVCAVTTAYTYLYVDRRGLWQ